MELISLSLFAIGLVPTLHAHRPRITTRLAPIGSTTTSRSTFIHITVVAPITDYVFIVFGFFYVVHVQVLP